MVSVGIVTLEGHSNFGNQLQKFALQEVLKRHGASRVECIHGLPEGEGLSLRLARRSQALAADPLGAPIGYLKRGSRTPDMVHVHPRRVAAIEAFARAHVHVAPAPVGEDGLRALSARYDAIIVGSDQVWNPAFTHGNPEWFLSFAPHAKRVAYSASFGVPQIPRYLARRYRSGLRGIERLSVREFRAAEIVRELTDRTPSVVLDPTILAGSRYWADLATPPAGLWEKEYVLRFTLKSGDSRSVAATVDRMNEVAAHYSTVTGLEVVDLSSPVDADLIGISPLDFIGAIRSARLVLTDSFHAAAFSTMFHVPFLIEGRGAMNSRFDTLLAETGLRDRMLGADVPCLDEASDIDWEAVDLRLANRRQESLAFLMEALR